MRLIQLAPLLVLAACGKKISDDSSQQDSGEIYSDTGEVQLTDEDHDGFTNDVDCDDNDATVNPEAEEICDEIDNNCNEEVDEGFDADADGHYDADQCEFGTDCDDGNADVNPDGEEIPYDGIDQDCSGADAADLDGDGYDAVEAGGDDCDDDNPEINPAAEDIAKNGIDEDCSGEDNIDGDGDGYGDETLGGSDCDDEDIAINPGATDWLNDGVDSNCDGPDGDEIDLDDVSAMVLGELDPNTGVPGYAGYAADICDLDDDGLGDVIVGAPFADYYNGHVGIFYGSGAAAWNNAMLLSSADTLIAGDDYDFIGWSIACGDHNGDGYTDLAVISGEVLYSALGMDKELRVLVYYGNGAPLGASLGDADADFVLNAAYGVPDAGVVYSARSSFYDMDGDGADEILMIYGNEDASRFDGEQRALVISGGSNTGEVDLEDLATHGYTSSQPFIMGSMWGTEDLNGDGNPEIVIGSAGYAADYDNDPDTNDGVIQILSGLDSTAGLDLELASSAASGILGASADFLFGFRSVEDDFDGDGVSDLIVSALGDDSGDAADAGALFAFSNAGDDMGTPWASSDSLADGMVYGNDELGYLGYNMTAVGDVNGNGINDLLVSEIYGGISGNGFAWLIDGSQLWDMTEVSDAAMYAWYASTENQEVGYSVAGGHDIDGDGINDMVLGSFGHSDGAGRVEILLSDDM